MGQFPFNYQWPNLTVAVIYVVLSQKLRQNFYACMLLFANEDGLQCSLAPCLTLGSSVSFFNWPCPLLNWFVGNHSYLLLHEIPHSREPLVGSFHWSCFDFGSEDCGGRGGFEKISCIYLLLATCIVVFRNIFFHIKQSETSLRWTFEAAQRALEEIGTILQQLWTFVHLRHSRSRKYWNNIAKQKSTHTVLTPYWTVK